MDKYELNNLIDIIDNPIIGKSLLTTFHKLNYCNYKNVKINFTEQIFIKSQHKNIDKYNTKIVE